MKGKADSHNPLLHVFSNPIKMKFFPIAQPSSSLAQQTLSPQIIQKFQNLLHWRRNQTNKPGVDLSTSSLELSRRNNSDRSFIQAQDNEKQLRYLYTISPNTILVGNKRQLDAVTLGMPSIYGYAEIENYWSLNLKTNIELVATDSKKFQNLCIVTAKTLHFYKYNPKNIEAIPYLTKSVSLDETPKFIYIFKEYLVSFNLNRVDIFLISEQRKKYSKQYPLKSQTFTLDNVELFKVPPPHDNSFNIFFEENKENATTFNLWAIELEITNTDVKLSNPKMAYQIKKTLRERISLNNFSKDIFLINRGKQILAVRKGYILDSVQMSFEDEDFEFVYFTDKTFFSVSLNRVDVYNFELNQKSKPYRIKTTAKDSLSIPAFADQNSMQSQFFSAVKIHDNYVVVFQQAPDKNMKSNGEIQYRIYITTPILRSQKFNRIFPKDATRVLVDDPNLAEKCSMAEKMGMTVKEIYLQLWNRSQKKKSTDFALLLCTKDYPTIKAQILNRLKKSSMKLREIYRLEDSCFLMLHEFIQKPSCKEANIIDFLKSHFFKRKLQLFRDIVRLERKWSDQEENATIRMTIQEYQEYETMDIKNQYILLVKQFCRTQSRLVLEKIKMYTTHFSFIFRTIYFDLLRNIVKAAREGLPILMKSMPQLLPSARLEDSTSASQVIWTPISSQEWRQSLYSELIFTIDTKQLFFEVVKGLWFRRNLFTHHDTVVQPKSEILQQVEKIKSNSIFYCFLNYTFLYISSETVLQEVVTLLENKYVDVPKHIRGKIFLYHNIFKYLEKKKLLPEPKNQEQDEYMFSDFLQLQDYEIFRHLFNIERSKKEILLNEVKPQCFEQGNYDKVFNEGLLNYFVSDISEISDLKYILNRINNRKEEFHQKNQELYVILVQALKRKMKVGTQHDIPISQVLIYINSIPLEHARPAFSELKVVEKIKNQSAFLSEARINMSIYEILNNQEELLRKLIEHKMQSEKIFEFVEEDEETCNIFDQLSYQTLARVESVSSQIYHTNNSETIFFLYITKLCEKEKFIKKARRLLQDQFLIQQGMFDPLSMPQSVVWYMYRWKMVNFLVYCKCEKYVRELLTLLPEDHPFVVTLTNQLELGIMLSSTDHLMTYPLSEGLISATDIEGIINSLSVQLVLSLDMDQLFSYALTIQEIAYAQIQEEGGTVSKHNKISLYKVITIFTLKLFQHRKLRESIPYLRRLLREQTELPSINIIYLIILFIEVSGELSEDNISVVLECLCYMFNQPQAFLDLIQGLLLNPYTVIQRKQYLERIHGEAKKICYGYDIQNGIFNEEVTSVVQLEGLFLNFFTTLQKTIKHLQHAKEEFKKIKYSCISIILMNNPYLFVKLIEAYPYLSLKYIRSFLSYVIQEEVFDQEAVLEVGRRLFLMLIESRTEQVPLESLIKHYQKIPLEEQPTIDFIPNRNNDSIQAKIWKSAETFRKKKISLQKKKAQRKDTESKSARSERLAKSLINVSAAEDRTPSIYPFSDSDDDNQMDDIFQFQKPVKGKNQNQVHFNNAEELNKIKQKWIAEEEQYGKTLHHSVEVVKKSKAPVKQTFSIDKRSRPFAAMDRQFSYKFEMNEIIEPDITPESEQQDEFDYQIQISKPDLKDEEKINLVVSELTDINEHNFKKDVKEIDLTPFDEIEDDRRIMLKVMESVYVNAPPAIPREKLVKLFIRICQEYPGVNINREILQIYKKAYQIERKHKLELSLHKIFTFDALVQPIKTPQQLFEEISSNVMSVIDDDSVFKVSKMIGLSLGVSSLQEQIVFEYMGDKLKEKYKIAGSQLNHFYQKIEALMEKIAPLTILERIDSLLNKADLVGDKDRIKTMAKRVMKKIGSISQNRKLNQRI